MIILWIISRSTLPFFPDPPLQRRAICPQRSWPARVSVGCGFCAVCRRSLWWWGHSRRRFQPAPGWTRRPYSSGPVWPAPSPASRTPSGSGRSTCCPAAPCSHLAVGDRVRAQHATAIGLNMYNAYLREHNLHRQLLLGQAQKKSAAD